MFAVGNNELKGRPNYREGTRILRQKDGKIFTVEVGTDGEKGQKPPLLGFIRNGEASFLVGVGGNLLEGWEPEYETCPHCGQSSRDQDAKA